MRRTAEGMTEIRLKDANFTSVFSAAEQKPLQKLETERLRQIFRAIISIQEFENADCRISDMFCPAFEKLVTAVFFMLSKMGAALVCNEKKRSINRRCIAISVPTRGPPFFIETNVFYWSQRNMVLKAVMNYEQEINTALVPQRTVKGLIVVRERESVGL